LFISFAVLNYYSIQAVLDANPVVLLAIIYLGMLFSLRAAADELLGALIALSLSHLEAGGPFLIFIILTASREQRNRVLIGFLMVSTILLAISFLVYPGWPIPFLRALMNNFNSTFGHSLRNALAVLWPARGEFLAQLLGILLAVLVIFEWSAARRSDSRGFLWTACLTLTVTPLLGWRTEMEHLATLVFPFLFVGVMAGERWEKRWTFLAFLLIGIGLVIPWLLFYLSRDLADPRLESLLFLFLPVFSLAGLYWVRWWALRAPRTWLDQIEYGNRVEP
jgi:hypothetical protein